MKRLIGKDIGSFIFTPVSKSITISGIDTFTQEQILIITHGTSGSMLYNFADPSLVYGTSVSASTITLAYNTTAMSGSDPLLIYMDIPDGDPNDVSLGVMKVTNQNPEWSRYTDPEALIASAQTITTTWTDAGPEVDSYGYNYIAPWIKVTKQNSTGIQFRALAKHTYAGSEEYDLPIQIVSSTQVDITSEVNQIPDANGLYILKVQTDKVIPYLQFQIKSTVSGSTSATLDTFYVTKG
jgi:hypothetical protein